MTEKANDVVIVGAGMAGLAAADQLYRNGISDFVILEASARSFKNQKLKSDYYICRGRKCTVH